MVWPLTTPAWSGPNILVYCGKLCASAACLFAVLFWFAHFPADAM